MNNFTEVGQEQLAHYFAYRQTIIDMLKNIFEDQKRKNFAYAINIAEDNFNLFSDTEKNFFDEDDEGYVETTIDEEAKKLLNRYY